MNILFFGNIDARYPLRQVRVVQELGRATIYADDAFLDCFLRSIDVCLRYSRCWWPRGASKNCDLECRLCVAHLNVERSVSDVIS